MIPGPSRLPKWVDDPYTPGIFKHHESLKEALSIAWAALDVYSKTHDGKEAEKAMRKIRKLGK